MPLGKRRLSDSTGHSISRKRPCFAPFSKYDTFPRPGFPYGVHRAPRTVTQPLNKETALTVDYATMPLRPGFPCGAHRAPLGDAYPDSKAPILATAQENHIGVRLGALRRSARGACPT